MKQAFETVGHSTGKARETRILPAPVKTYEREKE